MTATTGTFLDEISNAIPEDHRDAFSHLITMMTVAIIDIDDDATAYDYGRAIEEMLDALVGDSGDEGYDFKGKPRPESDDERPLYQRLDVYGGESARIIRGAWSTLQLFQLTLPPELLEKFHDLVVKPLGEAMGIPNRTQLRANPEAYPQVKTGFLSHLVDAAKEADDTDATNDYRMLG